MLGASRQVTAAATAVATALLLAACSSGSRPGSSPQPTAASSPVRIVSAPVSLLAATMPQANGVIWGLAGTSSKALYQLGTSSGVSVSRSARSVAESTDGVLGLALGSRRSGALELLDGHTAKPTATIALPAPARQVVAGSDGTTFYVLTGWPHSASVTVINSRSGRVRGGSIAVPAGAVSIAPNPAQTRLYVLQQNGLVDEISVAGGKILDNFLVGDGGISLALSPDGSTLYVLKGSSTVANIAVVSVGTERIRHVLPAPSDCRQVLVSANGHELYEVVGTASYGNIQIFAP
jgi:DNA-binding beta-propeller fold protein YncE